MKILTGSNLYTPHSLMGDSVVICLKNGDSLRMKITAFSMDAHIDKEADLIYKGYDTEGLNREIDVKEIEYIATK